MNTLEQRIRFKAIKSGIILGFSLLIISIAAFYFLTQVAKTAVLFLAGPSVFSFVLPILLVVLFCFNMRKTIGGYWTLRQATTGIFIMFAIAYAIQSIGRDLVFAKFIEPDMVHKTEVAAINATTLMMTNAKIPQQQIDVNVAKLKGDFELKQNVTVGSVVQSVVFSIIFIFVMALIFGVLFKKEPPMYETVIEEVS